ncbi:SDR family oxidoreductase [Agarivorans gilvus]|uniref:NAD(P)-dependent oxidoreductase n=1 Tax=Agarivorans gilvus TaxID=680279 RepID=A0ABQ1I0T2_9ALTE|nr:SDR family oxidoreductase [Agarivorans gilvus]GGA99177.1 NAD(P)-dependent oxidoreductase [Agarivorans gilvus]
MIKRISIVGCGWLGLPLAQNLLQQGFHILGSRRQLAELAELHHLGIEAYQLELNPEIDSNNIAALLDCDLLIINIPPRRKTNTAEFHIAQIQHLLDAAERYQVKRVLFISSTSVYGAQQGLVDESTPRQPETNSGKALKQIEDDLLSRQAFQASVLRFSGLVGGQRKPGRFLSGKTVSGASSPVNIIHRDDCIALISRLIHRDQWGECFNACSDQHPQKQAFYNLAAQQLGVAPPQFDQQGGSNKIISNHKIKSSLNYQFQFPDPMAWLQANKQEAE